MYSEPISALPQSSAETSPVTFLVRQCARHANPELARKFKFCKLRIIRVIEPVAVTTHPTRVVPETIQGSGGIAPGRTRPSQPSG